MSTKKIVMVVVSVVMSLIVFLSVGLTNLWASSFVIWGLHVSVWIGAVIIAIILGGTALLFCLQEDETPNWFIIAVVVAILICLVGGLVFTEPTKSAISTQTVSGQPYFRSYIPYYYIFGSTNSSGSSSSGSTHISTSSGDKKGLGYAVIVLLILLIAIGSFIIPHFWVSAVIGVLILLWGFTIKEVSDYGSLW